MLVFLTPNQLAVVHRAKGYFVNTLVNDEVRSMFREEGENVSVGLAYSEQGHHFIVRTVIPAEAGDDTIDDLCGRLVANLAVSYAKVMKRQAQWGA